MWVCFYPYIKHLASPFNLKLITFSSGKSWIIWFPLRFFSVPVSNVWMSLVSNNWTGYLFFLPCSLDFPNFSPLILLLRLSFFSSANVYSICSLLYSILVLFHALSSLSSEEIIDFVKSFLIPAMFLFPPSSFILFFLGSAFLRYPMILWANI